MDTERWPRFASVFSVRSTQTAFGSFWMGLGRTGCQWVKTKSKRDDTVRRAERCSQQCEGRHLSSTTWPLFCLHRCAEANISSVAGSILGLFGQQLRVSVVRTTTVWCSVRRFHLSSVLAVIGSFVPQLPITNLSLLRVQTHFPLCRKEVRCLVRRAKRQN